MLSPTDAPRHVLDEVGEYLQAGVRLVWALDPRARRVAVYRSLTHVRNLGAQDVLDRRGRAPRVPLPVAGLFGGE